MSGQQSIADLAVAALSAIQQMDKGVDMEHPERHAIRDLKRAADQAITDACRLAISLSGTAESVREAVKEAAQKDG